MLAGMITAVLAVLLMIGVAFAASWLDHPRESWYDRHLKRMWKDTKE